VDSFVNEINSYTLFYLNLSTAIDSVFFIFLHNYRQILA